MAVKYAREANDTEDEVEAELKKQQFVEPIKTHVAADKPFLGICLGLQLLMDVSYEDGSWDGLSIVPGKVVRFTERPELKVPHMGWNRILRKRRVPILAEIEDNAYFYFVHSYHVVPKDSNVIVTYTDYGKPFVSSIAKGNIFACQFHPEKSQTTGLKVLKAFGNI